MQEQTSIHETILRDIVDVITDVKDSDTIEYLSRIRQNDFKSLSSKTAGLTLVFPVITSTSVDIKTATMVAKAQERKAVTMLQILFSAININTEKDIFTFLRKYHTNIGNGTMSIEKFMDVMEDITTESGVTYNIPESEVNKIKNDLRNLDFYLESDYSQNSLKDFKIDKTSYGMNVLKESPTNPIPDPADFVGGDEFNKDAYNAANTFYKNKKQEEDDELNEKRRKEDNEYNRSMEYLKMQQNNYNSNMDRAQKQANDERKYNLDYTKDKRDRTAHMLVDTDVKKANELIPTLMIVRFNQVMGDNNDVIIPQDVIIGVKAKIYAVDSAEIVNRIINKNKDNNWMLKLVKATTREISFFKDFVFAIDQAKLDAKQSAAKGSTAKIFKILERRSSKSKFLRRIGANNTAAAISTIHISKEEVDLIKKLANVDVSKAPVIRKIMESYNLMSFVYSDESTESVAFIYDTGEDFYEVMSFNALEREQSDTSTKKIINLMTKMSR